MCLWSCLVLGLCKIYDRVSEWCLPISKWTVSPFFVCFKCVSEEVGSRGKDLTESSVAAFRFLARSPLCESERSVRWFGFLCTLLWNVKLEGSFPGRIPCGHSLGRCLLMISVEKFQPLRSHENEQCSFSSAAGGGIRADTGNTWQPLEPPGPAATRTRQARVRPVQRNVRPPPLSPELRPKWGRWSSWLPGVLQRVLPHGTSLHLVWILKLRF